MRGFVYVFVADAPAQQAGIGPKPAQYIYDITTGYPAKKGRYDYERKNEEHYQQKDCKSIYAENKTYDP